MAFHQLVAQQHIGAQGYPGPGTSIELAEFLGRAARVAVREFGKAALPWITWPTDLDEKAATEAEMLASTQGLIEAWQRRFGTDNDQAQQTNA